MSEQKPKRTFLEQLETFSNRKKKAQEGVKIPASSTPKTLFNGGLNGKE